MTNMTTTTQTTTNDERADFAFRMTPGELRQVRIALSERMLKLERMLGSSIDQKLVEDSHAETLRAYDIIAML